MSVKQENSCVFNVLSLLLLFELALQITNAVPQGQALDACYSHWLSICTSCLSLVNNLYVM